MLDELAHFTLVASAGTFTEAARRAHLSQPALSASIKRLEQSFGARLFHRGRSGAALTAAGEALLPHANAALAAVADGRRVVEETLELKRGRVVLGAGATACTYLLPGLLARFRKRHPAVVYVLREGFTGALVRSLTAGEVDLAIVSGDADGAGEPWVDDALVVVRSPRYEVRRGQPRRFVTFPLGSATRALLDERFPRAEVVMELSGIAAVKTSVRAGIGLALLSRSAVARDLRAGRLVEVRTRVTPIARPLTLVHRGLARLPPAAAGLRELLLARAAEVQRLVDG